MKIEVIPKKNIELGICRIVKKVVILGNQILYYGAKV